MTKPFTTEVFIIKAKNKHGNKYEYSNIHYINSQTKVTIICPTHGTFLQIPSDHLRGKGCQKCGYVVAHKITVKTNEKFIDEAVKVHGKLYDYSSVCYVNRKTNISIVCSVHGEFSQSPGTHLNGHGCPDCSFEKTGSRFRKTLLEFISDSKRVHGDKYDYSQTVYVSDSAKVIIICPIHGEFKQTPSAHLVGCGCMKCGKETLALKLSSNTKEFIKKSEDFHGKRYIYSEVTYVNNRTPVVISCRNHGVFKQTPNSHLRGAGCPVCSESRGERFIASLLSRHNVNHVREHMLPNYKFRYDFFLPDHNLFIEFHGVQHYDPVLVFGGKEAFDKLTFRDEFKRELAKGYNISIVYFNHKHLKNLKDFEKQILKTLTSFQKRKLNKWISLEV